MRVRGPGDDVTAGLPVRGVRGVWTAVLTALIAAGLAVVVGEWAAALFAATALLAWGLTPFAARWAVRVRAVALPGGRSVHDRPTPRLGGLTVALPVLGVLVGLAIHTGDPRMAGLAMGTALMGVIGYVDDVRELRARWKLLAQVAAVGVLFASGWRAPSAGIPEFGVGEISLLQFPLILGWVLVVTNAFNLVDGLDGVCMSVAGIAALGFVAHGHHVLLAVVLAGACVGFLSANLPRARMFSGDTGSLVVGFVVATCCIDLPPATSIPTALGLVAYPLGDLALSVLRRSLRGKPWWTPDARHVHHKIAEYLGGPQRTLLVVVAFALAQAAVALSHPGMLSMGFTLLSWVVVCVVLVQASEYRLSPALQTRRPIQRYHLLSQYVSRALRQAGSRDEVEALLRHAAEVLGVAALDLDGIALEVPTAGERGGPTEIVLPTRSATWTPGAPIQDRTLRRERDNILIEVVRDADVRLRALDPPA